MPTHEPGPDPIAEARADAERQAILDQRASMERQIVELRTTADALRSEAAAVGEPFEAALRADGPQTWTGGRADDFRSCMSELRGRLVGDGMLSVRYELENAALHCEMRANAVHDHLPR